MSGATAVLVLVGIVALAVFLILLGVGLSRRAQRREAAPARPAAAPAPPGAPSAPSAAPPAPAPPTAPPRLRDRLAKTRAVLAAPVQAITGRGRVDEETWDGVEEALLRADVGVATTTELLEGLRAAAAGLRATEPEAAVELIKAQIVAQLDGDADRSLQLVEGQTNVWMFVGVNGVGKTTAIAKLARRERGSGHSVMLAAADTFRAAAAEQLAQWGDRVGAPVVRGQEGADPGSVVFDAMSAAQARDTDLVLVDTAGRLHTKVNLMEELKKLRRIVERTPGALREVLLVIDATTGQNGLAQARQFADAVDVTGVVLTKLDGTARGGIVLAIEAELGIPVKAVGVGESADDLVPFDPVEFVDALFA
ncbi:MAG TPA: signal recognition particle-docking protein FtsY [Acidimicrobiia bacterium]